MKRAILVAALLAMAVPAQAQQQKDRKDWIIEAVEIQRNDALSKWAICYADGNSQVAALNKQVSDLQKQLDELKAKAAPAPQQ